MPIYALTIFLGAFLLFQVQPLMGKYILPWFGGGPGVWSACMLFFQALLLAGYAYAHATARWLKATHQVLLHLALLTAAVLALPIIPGTQWRPPGAENPTGHILLLLLANVGLPYFVLASTGPLLQHWFSVTKRGASPYRLYALSNAGSLLALLSYPVVVETNFTRKIQATSWGFGLGLYALACAACAMAYRKASRQSPPSAPVQPNPLALTTPAAPAGTTSIIDRMLWLILPACASALLLGVTNKLCLDVASVPFLWIAPLALYLLSFIICFDSPRWYRLLPYTLLSVLALGGICFALSSGHNWAVWKQVAVYCAGLFVCCMVCHGELYRLRPDPSRLTGYYLAISAGGALGGVFVTLIAPWIFKDYHELHWSLLLCAALTFFACARGSGGESLEINNPFEPAKVAESEPMPAAVTALSREQREWRVMTCILTLAIFAALDALIAWAVGKAELPRDYAIGLRVGVWALLVALALVWWLRGTFSTFRYWRVLSCWWLCLGVLALGTALWVTEADAKSEAIYQSRNFYGVLAVNEYGADDPLAHYHLLEHGRITHGLQFRDPAEARWPTTYYGEQSGVGLALKALPVGNRRLGLVGLGTGTLAAYGQVGDHFRIYEINPEVERVARSHFTYLRDCRAETEVVIGDARLSLEREQPQRFDLLALDAFSSDSIPVHLLTREAFETYQRHVKTNGIIAVHISNHYLDLDPVVRNLASHFGYHVVTIDSDESDESGEWWLYAATWMLLSRDEAILNRPEICAATVAAGTNAPAFPIWTDDYASVFRILR